MNDFVEKYMQGLGYKNLEDFAELVFRNSWSRGYQRWRILKEVIKEQGWDLASDDGYAKYLNYCNLVFNMAQLTDKAMKEMDLKEINDIPTLGRIIKYLWHDVFMCPTEIVEQTPDRTVVRTLWCGNPAYGPSPFGPHDCMFNYQEYYRLFDAGLTRDLCLAGLAEEAREKGLKEDVEVEMPWALCRDGDAPYCLYVMRKKGTPQYELPPLTDREKTYSIAQKIEKSGKKTMDYIAAMLDKTVEEVASGILVLYVLLDTAGYMPPETIFGKEKAQEMYNKYWLSVLYHWFREAKFELEIGKVTDIRELAEIIAFCERKKFIPYEIDESGKQIILTSKHDPFAEVSTQFLGMPKDSSYLNAIAEADDAFIGKIVTDCKMVNRARISVGQRLVRGDDKNEVVIEEI